jgi:hypothetical protein
MSVNALAKIKDENDNMVVHKKVMEVWWYWARWVVILMVVFIFVGLAKSINVLNDVFVVSEFHIISSCKRLSHSTIK